VLLGQGYRTPRGAVQYSGVMMGGSGRLNSVNQLIFVMVKCGVLFEVRTEFLNNI
jgi:hypothetical protein